MTPAEIKERRKALRLTQAEMGTALGYSPRTVEEWEQGKVKPPPILWRALEHLAAEKLAQRYDAAVQCADFRTVALILEAAETNPVLDRQLVAIDEQRHAERLGNERSN